VLSLCHDFECTRGKDFFEELWCYCNTLKIFTQGHIVGRIA